MSYIHGFNDNRNVQQESEPQELTWLDFLVISNPQGVMKVLSRYGYTGYLAPQDEQEMLEVCYELIDKYNEQAVIDLLKEHPLYGPISDICKEETSITSNFINASGDPGSIVTTIRTINYKKLAETALVLLGAFFLANRLWDLLTKHE